MDEREQSCNATSRGESSRLARLARSLSGEIRSHAARWRDSLTRTYRVRRYLLICAQSPLRLGRARSDAFRHVRDHRCARPHRDRFPRHLRGKTPRPARESAAAKCEGGAGCLLARARERCSATAREWQKAKTRRSRCFSGPARAESPRAARCRPRRSAGTPRPLPASATASASSSPIRRRGRVRERRRLASARGSRRKQALDPYPGALDSPPAHEGQSREEKIAVAHPDGSERSPP